MTILATENDLGLGKTVGDCAPDPDLQSLLTTQVDDLVKYQVVRLLHDHPDAIGDAAFFAAALGFHSAEYTQTSLEELVSCGILAKEACQGGTRSLYFLATDPANRERLTKLCDLEPHSPEYGQVLRLLASRSLRLARTRAKRNHRRGAC